ncbi:MAG TPA: helix-turn-helix domain-containing protein [Anaerolineaceae bacterium]|nr:helix-turn-helix domain-containing protein [Anaerolineaceae bacterium]HPN51868.1 helix-turn-helix domain-containing protein [Anaerolineaceae bacterium]
MEHHDPAASRMERKKEENRQKIIATAMGLFGQHGYDATTMEQIAAAADIAKGTLYNYFPVKEAILDAFIKQSFKERNAERIARMHALPDTRSRMIQMLTDLMAGVANQPVIFEKYFIYRIQNMIALRQDESTHSGLISLEQAILELGQQSGELRADLPQALLLALIEFVFIEVAQQYYRAPETFKASQTIEDCVDLFMNGAASRS